MTGPERSGLDGVTGPQRGGGDGVTGPAISTLADVVAVHSAERPDDLAIACAGREVSFGELHRATNRAAHALHAAGVRPGDRVAYVGRDSEQGYGLVFACAKLGAVAVPVNWRLTAREITHILTDSGAVLLLAEDEFRPVAEDVRAAAPGLRQVLTTSEYGTWLAGHSDGDLEHAARPDDPVLQLYTSGTTGLPKGVVLAHRSFFAIRDQLAAAGLDWVDWHAGDVNLVALPVFHVGGIWLAVAAWTAGVPNVLLPAFDAARAVELIGKYGVTTTGMVPAMLRTVLAHWSADPSAGPDTFRGFRKVVYGGSPISTELLEQCMRAMDCDFVQFYGLTETGNTAVCLPPADHVPGSERLRAAGRPYPGVELKIAGDDGVPQPTGTVGEVWIRTPARMVEYWRNPEATARTLARDWVRTGDAGRLDEDGYLYLHDRIKDVVIVAGENVYPAEIEQALAEHPGVVEAAVVGRPDERWGEAVHAFVVAAPGADLTPRQLNLFLRSRIAGFKTPTGYDFIDRLPRNPTGKVLRRVLREPLWAGRERQVN